MSSPSTTIYICQTLGLSNDYKHTFWFDNVTEQTSFFRSKVLRTFTDYTYTRKNWSLKLGASITDAERWGYLFFKHYPTGRYYYYFINGVKYVSDETVELDLEMDVMQTYMFDYALQPCFVEREHSSTDNPGDNTIEEDLETGLLINALRHRINLGELSVLVMSTVTLGGGNYVNTVGGLFDNIYSGCSIYRYKIDDLLNLAGEIKNLDDAGKTDAIVAIWMYPEALIETGLAGLVLDSKSNGVEYSFIRQPTNIDGYIPNNKKLLTYPYCYLYATNNSGNSAIYRYERFSDPTNIRFKTEGSIFPDGGIKFTPLHYNGIGENYDESLTLTGFPTCAWNADTYKIWLAQNQHSMNVQGASSVGASLAGAGMLIGGLATGNPLLMGSGGASLVHGVTSVASQLAQRKDMETHPPQSRGQTSSTLNTALGLQTIHIYEKCITKERLVILDNFFTMYGYKTLQVKVPNRNVRESFTYTKTQGCLITGALCNEDARKIQSIYDNGVTFWKKNVSIGNYKASNAVK